MKTSRPCLGPWLMSSLGKGACAWEPANRAGWQHPSLPTVSPVTPLRGQHQPRASSLLLPTKGEKSQDVGWEKSKIGKTHPGAGGVRVAGLLYPKPERGPSGSQKAARAGICAAREGIMMSHPSAKVHAERMGGGAPGRFPNMAMFILNSS